MNLDDQYGFYWYHSHFKTFYNDAVRGPLLIHPSASLRRPFERLAQSEVEKSALMQAERDATPVLLADWYHNVSNEVYQEYFRTGAFPNCVDSLLANGRGRVQCFPDDVLMAGPGLGIGSSSMEAAPTRTHSVDMASATMSSVKLQPTEMVSMSGTSASMSLPMLRRLDTRRVSSDDTSMQMDSLNALGCTPPMMFKPGYSINSLAPVTCTNTTSPLLTIPADYSQGWLALHLVNAAATSKLQVSIDAHSMYVFAADGLYVEMQEIKVVILSLQHAFRRLTAFRCYQLPLANAIRS